MNRLQRLHDAGVSIWLDTIRRALVASAQFGRMIDEDAVTGVTSNPSIFEKAISGSNDYDEPIRRLLADGVEDPVDLFFALGLEDIRLAADALRPAFDASNGRDGFGSFEVTPDLAHDTDATVEQALDLWARLDRPNVMIKVPGTEEGIPAIEELTAAGVNVNVTLLFSVTRYEAAAGAYIAGLERRLGEGRPIDGIASVARGHRRRSRAARGLTAPRAGGSGERPPSVPPVPGALLRRAMGAAGGRRSSCATPVVGVDGDEESGVLGRPVRGGAHRPRLHQHHARVDAARVPRPREGRALDRAASGGRRAGARRRQGDRDRSRRRHLPAAR